MNKARLKEVVLLVMAVDSPVLYFSATSSGATAATVAALAVMAAAAVVAAIVY